MADEIEACSSRSLGFNKREDAAIRPIAARNPGAMFTFVIPHCTIGSDRTAMDKDTSAVVPRRIGTATAVLRDHRYPAGTLAALIDTPFVTAPTRAALLARIATPAVTTPCFFDPAEFILLGALCDRLLGQDGDRRIDVPGIIDAHLASGETDGWRYDELPADGAAMRLGIQGFDETARALMGRGFLALSHEERDRVIEAVAAGDPPGETWAALPARRLFEDLLALATESYYAHPLAQEEIGYAGYADARGWQEIGLDGREPREPEPVGGPL